MSLNDI